MTTKKKQDVATAKEAKEAAVKQEMQKITGDPDAKYLGVAKAGGRWFKNHKTGTLYRVDGNEVKETRKSEAAKASKKKAGGDGPSRSELVLEAKAKKINNFRVMNKAELAEVLKPGTTTARIKQIEEGAVKRWKSGWKYNKKGK